MLTWNLLPAVQTKLLLQLHTLKSLLYTLNPACWRSSGRTGGMPDSTVFVALLVCACLFSTFSFIFFGFWHWATSTRLLCKNAVLVLFGSVCLQQVFSFQLFLWHQNVAPVDFQNLSSLFIFVMRCVKCKTPCHWSWGKQKKNISLFNSAKTDKNNGRSYFWSLP